MAEQGGLEELFVDEAAVTDDLIKRLLLPHIGLSRTEAKIIPRADFGKLSQRSRILLFLLSRHAMVKLAIPQATVEAETSIVADAALVPLKTCTELLSRLKAEGLVARNERGSYIPVHSFLRVAGELEKSK